MFKNSLTHHSWWLHCEDCGKLPRHIPQKIPNSWRNLFSKLQVARRSCADPGAGWQATGDELEMCRLSSKTPGDPKRAKLWHPLVTNHISWKSTNISEYTSRHVPLERAYNIWGFSMLEDPGGDFLIVSSTIPVRSLEKSHEILIADDQIPSTCLFSSSISWFPCYPNAIPILSLEKSPKNTPLFTRCHPFIDSSPRHEWRGPVGRAPPGAARWAAAWTG